MRALVKKEIAAIAIPLVVVVAVLCGVWLTSALAYFALWQPEPLSAYAILFAAGCGGFVAALFQFHGERIGRTQGYLLHRGSSTSAIFASKALVGLAATFLVAIMPPLVFALVEHATATRGSIVQWDRLAAYMWIAAFGAPAYAIGAVTANLRRNVVVELVFGLVCGGALAYLAILSSTSLDRTSPAVRYVSVQLAVAAALLWLARAIFERDDDRDMPRSPAMAWTLGAVGVALFVVPLLGCNTEFQRWAMMDLRAGRPRLLQDTTDGRFVAARDSTPQGYIEVGADGDARVGAVIDFRSVGIDTQYRFVNVPQWPRIETPARRADLRPQPEVLDGRWTRLAFTNEHTVIRLDVEEVHSEAYFDPRGGVVRAIVTPRTPSHEEAIRSGAVGADDFHSRTDENLVITVGRPDASERFSPRTMPVSNEFESTVPAWKLQSACLVDPDDGTFWRIDPLSTDAKARRVELPDRLVRVEYRSVFERARISHWGEEVVAVGERGTYGWDGRTFVALTPTNDRVPDPLLDYEFVFTDPDPITPRVEIRRRADGAVLHTQDLGIEGAAAHARLGEIYALSLVQSPLASVLGFFSSYDERGRVEQPFLARASGPLLYGQRRILLLLANLAAAAFAMRYVLRRERARGIAWSIAIAVLGVPVLGLVWIVEPRASTSLAHASSDASRPTSTVIQGNASVPTGAESVA